MSDTTAAAACWMVALAPPPPPRVRDVQRSSGMPSVVIRASSSLVSRVKVTVPSMSLGVSPASAIAARAASAASCSSLRPEFLENSVWPIPAMTAWFAGVIREQALLDVGRAELGQGDAALEGDEAHFDRHLVDHIADGDLLKVGDQPEPFLQLDQGHDTGLVLGLVGVPGNDPGVDPAPTRQLLGGPRQRTAARAHRCRRVLQPAAGGAAAEQQLVLGHALPKEGVVMADARSGDRRRHRTPLEMSDTSPPDARTTGDHVGLEVILGGHGRRAVVRPRGWQDGCTDNDCEEWGTAVTGARH